MELLNEDLVHPTLPHPFVIMLDINMPRMNGHEFLAALRASDDFRHLRVFMFTTSDSVRDIELAYQKNASGFIVKPSSASELINVLNSLRQFWAICADPPPGGRDGTDQMAGTC